MIQFGMFGTTTRYGDNDAMAKGTWVHVAEAFGETLWGMTLAKGGTTDADGSETREVSDLATMLLDPTAMFKARTARYLKRVPTGKFTKTGRPRYRYYYKVSHGGGVHNAAHMVAGASFAHGDGHYTIHGVGHDGHLQVSHSSDPSKMHSMSHDDLHDKLIHEHAAAYNEHHEKLKADHKEALASGNHRAAAKLREEAAKIGYNPIHDGPIPSAPGADKKPEAGLGKYPEHQVRQKAREAKEAIDHHTKKAAQPSNSKEKTRLHLDAKAKAEADLATHKKSLADMMAKKDGAKPIGAEGFSGESAKDRDAKTDKSVQALKDVKTTGLDEAAKGAKTEPKGHSAGDYRDLVDSVNHWRSDMSGAANERERKSGEERLQKVVDDLKAAKLARAHPELSARADSAIKSAEAALAASKAPGSETGRIETAIKRDEILVDGKHAGVGKLTDAEKAKVQARIDENKTKLKAADRKPANDDEAKPADDTDWSGGGAPAKSKKEVDDAEAARLAKIPKTKVEHSIDKASSNISGIAWTPHPPDANKPGKGTMRVRFKGGDAYDYKDVHHDAYEAVRRGDVNGSHGETLNKIVRGNHESSKVAEGTRGTTPINTETAEEMAKKTRVKQRADADAAKVAESAKAAEPAKEATPARSEAHAELMDLAKNHPNDRVRENAKGNLSALDKDPSLHDQIAQWKKGDVTKRLEKHAADLEQKSAAAAAERAANPIHPDGQRYADEYAKHLQRVNGSSEADAIDTAGRMVRSMAKFGANTDSAAAKAASKALGVKHTVGALADFVTGGQASKDQATAKAAKAKADEEAKASRLSPQESMQRARDVRSNAALDKSVRHDGVVKTRRQMVEDLHTQGYKVADEVHPNDTKGSLKGTYRAERDNNFYNLSPTEAAHMRSLRGSDTAKASDLSEAKAAATPKPEVTEPAKAEDRAARIKARDDADRKEREASRTKQHHDDSVTHHDARIENAETVGDKESAALHRAASEAHQKAVESPSEEATKAADAASEKALANTWAPANPERGLAREHAGKHVVASDHTARGAYGKSVDVPAGSMISQLSERRPGYGSTGGQEPTEWHYRVIKPGESEYGTPHNDQTWVRSEHDPRVPRTDAKPGAKTQAQLNHAAADRAEAEAKAHGAAGRVRLQADAIFAAQNFRNKATELEAADKAKAPAPAAEAPAPTRTNAEKLQATTERNQAAREAAKAEAPNHLANAQALYGMTDADMAHVGKSGYAAKAAEHAAAGRHDEAKAHVRLAIKDRLTRDSNRNMSASAAERYLKDKETAAAPKPVKAAKAPKAEAPKAVETPKTEPAKAEAKPIVHEGSSVHHGNVEYHVHSISNGDEGMDTTTVNPDGTRKTNDASVESSEANDKVPHANVTIVDHGKSIANPHRYGSVGSKTIHEKEENHRIPVSQLQALADSGKGRVESKAEKSARIAKMTENESEMHGIDSDDHPMSGEGHIDAEHKFLHEGARLHNHETGARHEIKGVNKDGSVDMVTHMPRTAEEKRPTTADRAKVQPKTETMSKKAMEAYIDKNKKVLSLRGVSDQNAKSDDTFNDLAARVKANPDHYLPASEDHIKAGRTVHTGNGMSYPIDEHGKIDEDGEDLDLDGMRGHAFVEKSPAEIEAVKKQIPLFRALRAQLRQALRMAAPGIMSLAKNMRA